MYDSCLKKQREITELFLACPTQEAKYEKIIELGKNQVPFTESDLHSDYLVSGCQSQVSIRTSWGSDETVVFDLRSDALISAGLGALLTRVYSGESPEVILKCPPTYLDEIGINESLTPNRASGLYSIHLRMKQDALKMIMEKDKDKK